MVSCALSKRRGPLRRPKVCLTHPNPGRCEPPPPPVVATCSLDPETITEYEMMPVYFILAGCDLNSETESGVSVVLNGGGGAFYLLSPLRNCTVTDAEFDDNGPGIYNLTATLTFESGAICVCTATVTIIPM